jgi:tellurite resistance protein
MEERETILEGYSDLEKGAYLGAIASIATADREASPEELQYIENLCDAAQLSPQQKQVVLEASTELKGEELNRCLDVLKKSELKYSLVADLMAFAKSDNNYSEEEQQYVAKISEYLGLDQKQFSLLDQFAEESTTQTEPTTPQGILSGGLGSKLQSAGINTGSLFKGLISIAAPMLIGGMLSRGLGRRGGFGGGLGNILGGGMGGLGMGGGLGSIIGMLNGGRGMRSTVGLFGRMFGSGF